MKEMYAQRIRITKQLLKTALCDMLKEENIYKISIRELCDRAGVNRSTFYKHYGSQFDLLREIENDVIEDAISFLREHPGDYETSICMICKYFEQNQDLVRMILDESRDSSFTERLFSLPEIQLEIKRNFAPGYTDDQIAYASCFMVYGYLNTMRMWLIKDDREPAEELAAFLVQMSEPARLL